MSFGDDTLYPDSKVPCDSCRQQFSNLENTLRQVRDAKDSLSKTLDRSILSKQEVEQKLESALRREKLLEEQNARQKELKRALGLPL